MNKEGKFWGVTVESKKTAKIEEDIKENYQDGLVGAGIGLSSL